MGTLNFAWLQKAGGPREHYAKVDHRGVVAGSRYILTTGQWTPISQGRLNLHSRACSLCGAFDQPLPDYFGLLLFA